MALLEKDRNTIYNAFVPLMGEEATQAMLSQFPARDLDEPVTKEFVRAEIAGLRAEMHRELHALGDRLTTRMIAINGAGLAAMAAIVAIFT